MSAVISQLHDGIIISISIKIIINLFIFIIIIIIIIDVVTHPTMTDIDKALISEKLAQVNIIILIIRILIV